jgi:hypothetical protein
MSGHAHALAMAALDVNGPEGGPLDWGRDHLASPRGQRTAAEAEDLQGDVGTGLTAHAPRGLLEPCAGTTRLHGSEEAVGAAMRPPLSDDHGRLKPRLRAMRGLKQLRCARVITVGHAFIQNIHRGHYELGAEETVNLRILAAFDELALVI